MKLPLHRSDDLDRDFERQYDLPKRLIEPPGSN